MKFEPGFMPGFLLLLTNYEYTYQVRYSTG